MIESLFRNPKRATNLSHVRRLVFLFLSCAVCAAAQSVSPSDSLAVSLAQQSVAALTGGTSILDANLTANVIWIAGSDSETGAAVLAAKGTGESRVDLRLTGGIRSEIRNDTAGYPQGASVTNGGSQQTWALHNCWINASWFFPALSFLSATADPTLVFSYLGQERRNGLAVQHIRISRYLVGQSVDTISLTSQLSAMDVYLDSATLLPQAFTFMAHPEDDALTNIAVEIRFSAYHILNGIRVPSHIQKLISGGVAVDINVTSVSVNSGLDESLFSLQ